MLNFLCIGAHKAGTTWLHSNLTKHPEVWLPPYKELHFFDQFETQDTTSQLYRRINWASKELKIISSSIKVNSNINEIDFMRLDWVQKYTLTDPKERNLDWYKNLFNEKYTKGKVAGEITPAYALLKLETYKNIKSINPNVKVIFMMRNPIERIWSAFRFDKLTKKDQVLKQNLLDDFKLDDFYKYASRKAVKLRSEYLTTIFKIEKVFSKENIHYIFFDDLEKDPYDVMEKVCIFLNIEYSKDYFPNLQKKQLVSKKFNMPDEINNFLQKEYATQISELNKKISVPESWFEYTT